MMKITSTKYLTDSGLHGLSISPPLPIHLRSEKFERMRYVIGASLIPLHPLKFKVCVSSIKLDEMLTSM